MRAGRRLGKLDHSYWSLVQSRGQILGVVFFVASSSSPYSLSLHKDGAIDPTPVSSTLFSQRGVQVCPELSLCSDPSWE